MDYIMETVGLRKAYKDNIVVDDVNMHISKGAIYGFVGPNGAGKSTVMKMILSVLLRTHFSGFWSKMPHFNGECSCPQKGGFFSASAASDSSKCERTIGEN